MVLRVQYGHIETKSCSSSRSNVLCIDGKRKKSMDVTITTCNVGVMSRQRKDEITSHNKVLPHSKNSNRYRLCDVEIGSVKSLFVLITSRASWYIAYWDTLTIHKHNMTRAARGAVIL